MTLDFETHPATALVMFGVEMVDFDRDTRASYRCDNEEADWPIRFNHYEIAEVVKIISTISDHAGHCINSACICISIILTIGLVWLPPVSSLHIPKPTAS